jgi:hypothetical protein
MSTSNDQNKVIFRLDGDGQGVNVSYFSIPAGSIEGPKSLEIEFRNYIGLRLQPLALYSVSPFTTTT